jgi:hypothetical protein
MGRQKVNCVLKLSLSGSTTNWVGNFVPPLAFLPHCGINSAPALGLKVSRPNPRTRVGSSISFCLSLSLCKSTTRLLFSEHLVRNLIPAGAKTRCSVVWKLIFGFRQKKMFLLKELKVDFDCSVIFLLQRRPFILFFMFLSPPSDSRQTTIHHSVSLRPPHLMDMEIGVEHETQIITAPSDTP